MTRWPDINETALNHFPLVQRGNGGPIPSRAALAEGWKTCIFSLLDIRELEDDWDGQGTPAPSTDLVDSATILAILLRRRDVLPPKFAYQTLSGGVLLDWPLPDKAMITVEVTRPYEAEVIWYSGEGETTATPLFDPVSYVV